MAPQNIYDNPDFFEAYKTLREGKAGFNDALEQPAIISLLPDLSGKRLLELGCGFGDFAAFASDHGAAAITAIDVSSKMISTAKEKNQRDNITFKEVAVEHFAHSSGAFDLIVSSLALHYVEDFDDIAKKVSNLLKPGGLFIFSVEHPICTAYPEAIIKTDEAGRSFHPIYNYRDEIAFEQTWFVPGVKKYHRKVSTYINTLIKNNMVINNVLEPMPSDELIDGNEKFSIHKIRPPLLIIKATVLK